MTTAAHSSKPRSSEVRQRLLLDVRNSTLFQVDNFSAKEQLDAMVRIAEQRHPGCEVVLIDEQGTSGADLSKRHAFRDAIQQIKNGSAHGIIVYDIKRLTRDPFGIDGGQLAKMLVENHGILVTQARDYNLRFDEHLTDFHLQCFIAGLDWRGIRNTFWRGMFKKMETEAVIRRPPLGYMTVREFGDRAGTLRKHVAKNPEHAHVMEGLRLAFEACDSVRAVCAWLADHGYERPPIQFGGHPVDYWTPHSVEYILKHNELYTGWFVFGRDGKRASPVWEATGRSTNGEIRTEVAELAYWTVSDAARWRRKFFGKWETDMVRSRNRKYPHPLTGVLNCGVCGRPMVSAGAFGYRCQGANNQVMCSENISTPVLLRTIRPLLPDLLANVKGFAAEAARQQTETKETGAERELIAAEQRATSIRKLLVMLEEPDPEVASQLDQLNRRIKVLREQVRVEKAEAEQATDIAGLIDMLSALPHLFDSMTPDQQSRVYAKLLSDLRLTGTGRYRAKRYTVTVAVPRLSTELAGSSRSCSTSYTSMLIDLAAEFK